LQQNIRESDTLGRWGGEEFMIIIPKTTLRDASFLAEKLRNTIALYNFDSVGHKTASFGIAMLKENEQINDLIMLADAALYQSKNNGRNCVSCANE